MRSDRKVSRIGEVAYNSLGNKMTIIDYINTENISIIFENGYITKNKTYHCFKIGAISNPYNKTFLNIGYLGEGDYNTKKNRKIYKDWYGMLSRCYDVSYKDKYTTYKNCEVCEEWHNFQNFAKWYDENFYEIEDHRMELDKDILFKGNKVYSPETCVFVPNRINSLFIKSNAKRGDYPIGVSYDNKNNKYMASGKNVYLGYYNTVKEAFNTYKEYKEKLIKQIANQYKNIIPQKLYDAMYSYEVEITD